MIYRIAGCQMMPSEDIRVSRERFEKAAREAAAGGAEVLVFPEMWTCPYIGELFAKNKEPQGGETFTMMADLAKELGVYIFGGSIPEEDGDKVYNTCYVFDPEGNLIGKHRKAHLFDVDIKGGITFTESNYVGRGDKATVVDTKFGKIGVAICFDIRFAEFSRKMVKEGAEVIVLPAAFNLTTGPAHWELSIRMRATDNQVYFMGVQPARDPDCKFKAWGHSTVSDPFGVIIDTIDENEGIIYCDVDTDRIASVREELPILSAMRPELY